MSRPPAPGPPSADQKVLARYSRLYRTSLALVAVVVTGTAVATATAVRLDDGTGEQVNVSGRQRMLSQRIALMAGATFDDPTDAVALQQLRDGIALMRTSHVRLTDPNAAGSLVGRNPAGPMEVYFGEETLDARVRSFLDSANVLVHWIDDGRPAGEAARAERAHAFVVAEAGAPLLAGLDSAVSAWERAGETSLDRLVTAELLLTALSLALLILIGAGVFEPMGRRLQNAFEETREREARIASTRHLHKVGLLATTVAHDLKNYAGVARGNMQLLQEDLADSGEQPEMAEEVIGSLDRIEATARRLLGLARTDDLQPTLVEAAACLDGLEALLRAAARPARLTLEVPQAARTGCRVVVTDFESAVLNLVGNAGEAIAASGGNHIQVEVVTEPGFVVIRVSDDGPGIPMEIRDSLFEPFVSGKTRDAGSGLGLSQVRGFAESSGGTVELATDTSGTVFTVRLPSAD